MLPREDQKRRTRWRISNPFLFNAPVPYVLASEVVVFRLWRGDRDIWTRRGWFQGKVEIMLMYIDANRCTVVDSLWM